MSNSSPRNSLVIPPHIQRGIDVIRENGLCGEVSHNLTRVCLKDAGHEGEHGDKDWSINLVDERSPQSDLHALRDRLYAALKHEKSCTCGECSGGLNAVDDLVEQADIARGLLERALPMTTAAYAKRRGGIVQPLHDDIRKFLS